MNNASNNPTRRSMTTIITNNQPRNLLCWEELTEKEQAEFYPSLIDNDEDFVRYKRTAYRLADFILPPKDVEWDGVIQDTFFSGILIRFTDDEEVIMGRYYE